MGYYDEYNRWVEDEPYDAGGGGSDWGSDNPVAYYEPPPSPPPDYYEPPPNYDAGGGGSDWGNDWGNDNSVAYYEPPPPPPPDYDAGGGGSDWGNDVAYYEPPTPPQDQGQDSNPNYDAGGGGQDWGNDVAYYEPPQLNNGDFTYAQPTPDNYDNIPVTTYGPSQLPDPSFLQGRQRPSDYDDTNVPEQTPPSAGMGQGWFDGLGNWIGNTGGAFLNPIVNNPPQINNPWDALTFPLNAAERIGQGALGAMGEGFKPIGAGVAGLAASNDQGTSALGKGLQTGWENLAEPLMYGVPSAIGQEVGFAGAAFKALTNPGAMTPEEQTAYQQAKENWGLPNIIADPFRNIADHDNFTRDMTAKKISYVQDAYVAARQAGQTPEEASATAQELDGKLNNSANLTEYAGAQAFGTLPALAQLGVMFIDPVAGKGLKALGHGHIELPAPEGLQTPLARNLVNAVQPGVDFFNNTYGRVAPAALPGTAWDIAKATPLVGDAIRTATRLNESPELRSNRAYQFINANMEQKGDQVGAQWGDSGFEQALGQVSGDPNHFLSYNNPDVMHSTREAKQEVAEYIPLEKAILAQVARNTLEDAGVEWEAQPYDPNAPAAATPAKPNEPSVLTKANVLPKDPNGVPVEFDTRKDAFRTALERDTAAQYSEPLEGQTKAAEAVAAFDKDITDPQQLARFEAANPRLSEAVAIRYNDLDALFGSDKVMDNLKAVANSVPDKDIPAFISTPEMAKYLPKIDDPYSKYLNAVHNAHEYVVGRRSFDPKTGLVTINPQLSQFPLLGRPLSMLAKGSNKVTGLMADLYLNTWAHATKLELSNQVKLLGMGHNITAGPRLQRRANAAGLPQRVLDYGSKGEGNELQPNSGKRGLASKILAAPNRALALPLKALSKGKFTELPELNNYLENYAKHIVYNQAGLHDLNLSVGKLVKAGKLTREQGDYVLGRAKQLEAEKPPVVKEARPDYAPPPETVALRDKLAADPDYGHVATIFSDDRLKAELADYNAAQAKREKSGLSPQAKRKIDEGYAAGRGDDLSSLTPSHPVIVKLGKEARAEIEATRARLEKEAQAKPASAPATPAPTPTPTADHAARAKELIDYLGEQRKAAQKQAATAKAQTDATALKDNFKQQQATREGAYERRYGGDRGDILDRKPNRAAPAAASVPRETPTPPTPASSPALAPHPNLTPTDAERYDAYARELASHPSPQVHNGLDYANKGKPGYIDDLHATDKAIRDITGNTFKLDPETLKPTEIDTGKTLDELRGVTPKADVSRGTSAPASPIEEKERQHSISFFTQELAKVDQMLNSVNGKEGGLFAPINEDFIQPISNKDFVPIARRLVQEAKAAGKDAPSLEAFAQYLSEQQPKDFAKKSRAANSDYKVDFEDAAQRDGITPSQINKANPNYDSQYHTKQNETNTPIRQKIVDHYTQEKARIEQTLKELNEPSTEPTTAATPATPTPATPAPTFKPEEIAAAREVLNSNPVKQRWNSMVPKEKDEVQQAIAAKLNMLDPKDPAPHVDPATPKPPPPGAPKAAPVPQTALDYLSSIKDSLGEHAKKITEIENRYRIRQEQAAQDLKAQRGRQKQLDITRAHLQIRAGSTGYRAAKESFFDYQDKTYLDQMLNIVLPFNYWARKNFVFVVKHFAKNPMQLAAILNFYDATYRANSQNGIPEYARGDILLWENPTTHEKYMWNQAGMLPWNLFGDNESVIQAISPGDADYKKSANKAPLFDQVNEFLFGKDRYSKKADPDHPGQFIKGDFTGRDKGLIPSLGRINPIIDDLLLRTGAAPMAFQKLGWTKDNLGLAGPVGSQSLGVLPYAGLVRDAAAITGGAKAGRGAGFFPADFNLEGPANEFLFKTMPKLLGVPQSMMGRDPYNPGKPNTAVYDDLALRAETGEITKEQARQALISYKQGKPDEIALASLDKVEGEDTLRKGISTLTGAQGLSVNNPRQATASDLFAHEQAIGAEANKGKSSGKGKDFVEGDFSKFFNAHPGATVLSDDKKTPEELQKATVDDKTRQAEGDLGKKLADHTINIKEYNQGLAQLIKDNPDYFKDHPLKTDEPARTLQNATQDYKDIGGDKFAKLQEELKAAYAADDQAKAHDIENDPIYKQALKDKQAYLDNHPEVRDSINAYNATQGYKPIKTRDEFNLNNLVADYHSIAAGNVQELRNQLSAAYANKDTATINSILNNPAYKKAQLDEQNFLDLHPDVRDAINGGRQAKGETLLKPHEQFNLDNLVSDYYNLSDDKFKALQAKLDDAFKRGDKKAEAAILNDPHYQDMQQRQQDFLKLHPDVRDAINGGRLAKGEKELATTTSAQNYAAKGGTTAPTSTYRAATTASTAAKKTTTSTSAYRAPARRTTTTASTYRAPTRAPARSTTTRAATVPRSVKAPTTTTKAKSTLNPQGVPGRYRSIEEIRADLTRPKGAIAPASNVGYTKSSRLAPTLPIPSPISRPRPPRRSARTRFSYPARSPKVPVRLPFPTHTPSLLNPYRLPSPTTSFNSTPYLPRRS